LAEWTQIRAEYITTETSYRRLAKKYGVALTTLSRRAQKEKWKQERETYWNTVRTEVVQRTQEDAIEKHVDAAARISAISDKLLDKLEQAAGQLDRYMVQDRTRRKVTTYGKTDGDDRIVTEEMEEKENKRWVTGEIDRDGLKKLASALRDLKEIKGIRGNHEMDEDGTGVIILGERDDE